MPRIRRSSCSPRSSSRHDSSRCSGDAAVRRDPGPGRGDVRCRTPLAQANRAGGGEHAAALRQNPPDRTIADDDILFCDFGPIFEGWEADFGRTFVLGDDAVKHALRDDLARVWAKGREYFDSHQDVTGAELFDHVVQLSHDAGWEFGGTIAGHLVGEFPHELIEGDKVESYIAPGSEHPMRRTDRTGRVCHWILEVHLTDPARGFGGFYEELLDLA